jgi:photosystem II stability/assembly factor-like uncharacterized protein
MKFKIFVLLIGLIPFSSTHAQWKWSNPQPSGYSNTKIEFTDSVTGYVISSNGDLLKTTDQGLSWHVQQNFPHAEMMDILDSTFLITGGRNAYVSTDNAQTWQTSSINTGDFVTKIEIVSKDTFFAVSTSFNFGTTELFQSVDGGRNWQLINSTFILQSVDFINSKLAYATSHQGIVKTTDGGKTWAIPYIDPISNQFSKVKFYNDTIGYAFGSSGGIIYKTRNGGVDWVASTQQFGGRVIEIFFLDSLTTFAGDDHGGLYRTRDGGASWQFLRANNTGDAFHIYSICFLNQDLGFIAGLRGRIVRTIDGGTTWKDYAATYIDISHLSFPTAATGYAVSWNDIFKTTDAGQTWSKAGLTLADISDRFQFLHFFSGDTGLALAGNLGKLYKTYNAGASWQTLALPLQTADQVTGFHFINNIFYLYITGLSGLRMISSRDQGETWQPRSVLDFSYHNQFFIDEKTGYGNKGPFLYKTTDSAKTWTQIFINDNATINTIWFTSPNTGFIMGGNGFNQRTDDGGQTWTRMYITPDNFNFHEIFTLRFFNEKLGYFLGRSGIIYKTLDGGHTWLQDWTSPWECRAMAMTADTSIFIAGDKGIILKKDMREYILDSLKVSADGSCHSKFSAKISAVLSTVDSVWFEYGTDAFSRNITGTPGSVADSTIKAEAVVQGLSTDSIYQLRLKIYYRGSYHYSYVISFKPAGLARPVIVSNGTVLTSSAASGNQWFLNNAPINGATAATYQPVVSGLYTVQQQVNGCTSNMSVAFNFVATAINDPVLSAAILTFPNPVTSILFIRNKEAKKLLVTFFDVSGRVVKKLQTSKADNSIDCQGLHTGVYLLVIEETSTHRKITRKLVKL